MLKLIVLTLILLSEAHSEVIVKETTIDPFTYMFEKQNLLMEKVDTLVEKIHSMEQSRKIDINNLRVQIDSSEAQLNEMHYTISKINDKLNIILADTSEKVSVLPQINKQNISTKCVCDNTPKSDNNYSSKESESRPPIGQGEQISSKFLDISDTSIPYNSILYDDIYYDSPISNHENITLNGSLINDFNLYNSLINLGVNIDRNFNITNERIYNIFSQIKNLEDNKSRDQFLSALYLKITTNQKMVADQLERILSDQIKSMRASLMREVVEISEKLDEHKLTFIEFYKYLLNYSHPENEVTKLETASFKTNTILVGIDPTPSSNLDEQNNTAYDTDITSNGYATELITQNPVQNESLHQSKQLIVSANEQPNPKLPLISKIQYVIKYRKDPWDNPRTPEDISNFQPNKSNTENATHIQAIKSNVNNATQTTHQNCANCNQVHVTHPEEMTHLPNNISGDILGKISQLEMELSLRIKKAEEQIIGFKIYQSTALYSQMKEFRFELGKVKEDVSRAIGSTGSKLSRKLDSNKMVLLTLIDAAVTSITSSAVTSSQATGMAIAKTLRNIFHHLQSKMKEVTWHGVPECPGMYQKFGSNCLFLLESVKMSWTDACNICSSLGGQVASVELENDLGIVKEIMHSHSFGFWLRKANDSKDEQPSEKSTNCKALLNNGTGMVSYPCSLELAVICQHERTQCDKEKYVSKNFNISNAISDLDFFLRNSKYFKF